MNKDQKGKYEVLVRVRDFGAAHQELFPESSVGRQAFAEVAQSVVDIEAHFAERVRAAEETRRVTAAKRRAVVEAMRAITHTGRGWATRATGHNLFRMPRRRSAFAVLEAARRFIVDAEPRKETFVRLGLSPDFLTELRTATDAFVAAVDGRRAGRADARTARAALQTALARGFAALRTLDVVVINAVRRDPVRAAAWDGARRIEGSRRASSDATKVASAPEAAVVETTGAPASRDAANTFAAFEASGTDAAAGAADAVAATATDVAARPLTSDDVLDKAS